MAHIRLTVAWFYETEEYLVSTDPVPQVDQPDRVIFSIQGQDDTPGGRRLLMERFNAHLASSRLTQASITNLDDIARLNLPLSAA